MSGPVEGLAAARLDPRQLELLAQELGQFLDRDLDLADVLGGLIAGTTGAVGFTEPHGCAFFTLALADPVHLFSAINEARQLDLGYGYGNDRATALADQLTTGNVLAEIFLYATADDRIEPLLIPLDPLDRRECAEPVPHIS